jgi:dihydroxyacetone kinase-like protein
MSQITPENTLAWIQRYADHVAEQKDFLTQLDAAIGDADHGANMHRGFQAVLKKFPEMQDKDLGTIFKTVAMTLISTVGGASGALYGTFFLQASTVAIGKTEVSPLEFVGILEKGLAGIVLRGKAAIGDKTMIDALQPAIKALRQDLENGSSLPEAMAKALEASQYGAKSTIPLVAKKGRASYLGERSANHQDPGATSTALLFQALAETMK